MKISKSTLDILSNFASINPSIVIRPGNKLRTMNAGGGLIFAEALVPEQFTRNYGIFDLHKLLSLLKMYDDPEIEELEGQLKVRNAKQKTVTSFRYTDPKLIPSPPDDKNIVATYTIHSKLTHDQLNWIRKTSSIIGTPDVAIVGVNQKLYVQAIDMEGKVVDSGELELGDTDEVFKAVLKVDRLKVIPGDYQIHISKRGMLFFEHETYKNLKYWLPLEQSTSEFN